MKKPLIALAAVPLALWAVFALPGTLAEAQSFWDWRRVMIVLSGVLALWWMSAGMVLAARPAWLERRLGGLDKLYRLHKAIGIGGGILVLCHWLAEWLPKNLAKLGLLDRPNHPHGHGDENLWLELAKEVGEWAGYILMALVVVALAKRLLPYRYFRWLHKAFGLVFLAGAYHGLMFMPESFWQQPLGWLTVLVAALGIVPAFMSLAGRIGDKRRCTARIEALRQLPDHVLEVVLRPTGSWPGHRAGQFLLADFGHAGEGAHPFTIASAWSPEGTLTVAIKALGDYTASLPQRLTVSQSATLEGPYGDFTFAADGRQVWIAGGIGITPFLARLRELAAEASTSRDGGAEFFYCTRASLGPELEGRLEQLCQEAGVRLHRRFTDEHGPLDPAEVEARLAPNASVWFCGPATWGKALAATLSSRGLPAKAFRREAFEFR